MTELAYITVHLLMTEYCTGNLCQTLTIQYAIHKAVSLTKFCMTAKLEPMVSE